MKAIGKTALAIILMAFMMTFAAMVAIQGFIIVSSKQTQVKACTLALDVQSLEHDKGTIRNITSIVKDFDTGKKTFEIITPSALDFIKNERRFFDTPYEEIAEKLSVVNFRLGNNNNETAIKGISISVVYNDTKYNLYNISLVDRLEPFGRKSFSLLMKDDRNSPKYIEVVSVSCTPKIPTLVFFTSVR